MYTSSSVSAQLGAFTVSLLGFILISPAAMVTSGKFLRVLTDGSAAKSELKQVFEKFSVW